MGDDSEWLKLPAEEKVQHKVWKARVAGYEEATKVFRTADEKSPEFNKYAGLMKKFVTDSNAIAQEKALDAVLAFVENGGTNVVGRTAGEVVSGVITKCLNASKQKTKEKGIEIIMLYIEAEKQDVVHESLLEGLSNKQPKVVMGCIQCLREGLRDFGNKIMPIKPMLKSLPKLLEDRDKNVRAEAKQLIVEMFRWIGAAIKPQLTNFKPVQVAELEAEFESLPNEKAQQVRFLRSQQDLKSKMEERAAAIEAGEDVEEEEAAGEEIDPYELIPAVDIIAALPKDFFDKVEAKKWQERREALEALQKLVENPKIEPGDHGAIVKVLMKVIGKDTNVMLVAIGGKCLAGLASGLRKKFSPYAPSCFPVILDKFKEKKSTVVTALREAADAAFGSINLDVITEDLMAALENKNPNIKAETASFLCRCFLKQTLATLPKKQLKVFCSGLLKTINDTSPEVREASFQALGAAMKVVTEKHITQFIADVDSIKLQKIKECCENSVLLNAKGEPRTGGGGAPKAGSSQPKPVARPSTAPEKPATGAKARPKTAPAARPGGPPKSAPKKAAGGGKGKGAVGKKGSATVEKVENPISDEALLDKATDLLTAEVLGQLESSNWKERLAGMEKFKQVVQVMSKEEIPCQVCVRTVNKKPGLKDTNFQVLKLRIDMISHLAQNAVFSRTSAEFCLSDLVDKVGDVKNGAAVQECFSCIAEAVSLEYVSTEVVKMAFDQKNPKNQSESLNWLAKAVKEFGMKVNVKAVIQYIKKAFAATNPAVRSSAINITSVLYMYMGQQLRMFFEDEKAALLQQLDAEFEKVKGEKPPPPTRGLKSAGGGGDEEEDEEEGGAEEGQEESVADLVPRNDIGDRFSPELITSMSDKNWKVRGEALQKVISILNEAKFITGNLGPLPEAIKGRLADANKNLVTTTLGICVTLATNMGPHCKAHVKIIGPALISCLADSKPTLRSTAVGALNAWVDQTTLTPLVEAEALSDGLKTENPFLRQELLAWLIERLPNHKQLPKDEMKLCVPHILNCLEDRNGEVRKKAQESLVPFMIHVGYDSFARAAGKQKPASKDQLMQLIDKAREGLPAKAPRVKKAPSKSPPREEEEAPEPVKKAPKVSPTSDAADGKAAKGPGKTKAKPAAAPSKRKKVEEDTSAPVSVTVTKEQRFKDEKNMKVLKWNFVEPRPEFVEQLKLQMEKNFSKSMMDQLFHSDFKFHIKAIETLIKCLDSLQDEQVANVDILLKWFTLRFFDTNPSMLNKALEYLQALFGRLIERDYHLHELEATAFLPYLVIKVGENKDNVRRDVRSIFKLIYKVYPASKMFVFIMDGFKSKNSKQRTECLEELGFLIENYSITICQPSPAQALKTIAAQISDRDNGVRNAALNTTVVAYQILGETLYKYIGTLKEKDQSYLDERIKRSAKNKPAGGQAKGDDRPRTAPQQPQRSASQATIQRPSTAIPKSASSNSMRKEFQLEVDAEVDKHNYNMPQLFQCDIDELFQQPVQFPTIKARPPSPAAKFLNSADTVNTVNFVISQVTNRDINTCIQALAQIDEVLKDKEKSEVMVAHVEQLLVAMSMQFKMAYTTHMGDEDTSKDDVIRLYRCLLGTLLALFQNASLAKRATKDILKDLMHSLVTMLLDNRLMKLDDGPQVVRSVNVLVVKIVEKSDQTNALCALIRLLQECCASETCTNKFLELIMKCLWKMSRMLPGIIEDLNLDRVLYDAHLFLRAFPSHTWKDRPNDVPLRTIKTIIHSIAKIKGSKVLSHLGQIDAGEESEVKAYLQKVLQREGLHHAEVEMNGTDDNKLSQSSSKKKRISRTTHDMLSEIFKKIGSKENTKEGLNSLYEFKQKYPDADLEPFLKKSSCFFQNYIERGLKDIEKERQGKLQQAGTERMSSDGVLSSMQPASDQDQTRDIIERAKTLTGQVAVDIKKPEEEVDFYRERLRMLRAQCGLDTGDKVTKNAESSESQSAPVQTTNQTEDPYTSNIEMDVKVNTEPEETPAPATGDISKLKERLAKIKKMANS